MNKIEVTIIESKWVTGGSNRGQSALRNELGYCCCLGFICETVLGEKFPGKNYPENTHKLIPEITEKASGNIFPFNDTILATQAARINDNRWTSVQEKKRLLTELFKDSCYSLKFVP